MKAIVGKSGVEKSFQDPFNENAECVHCGGLAEIAFVAHEGIDEDDRFQRDSGQIKYVCDLKKNMYPESMWVHDCCAVAVYFCTKCLKATAIMNQG